MTPQARTRLALTLVTVIVGLLILGGVSVVRRSLTVPGAGDQLRALENDPIVKLRAPGTTLSRYERAAARKTFTINETFIEPSRVELGFVLAGDPTDVADAYLAAARTSGWQLVNAACARDPIPAIRLEWQKDFHGFGGSLSMGVSGDASDPAGVGTGSVAVSATSVQPTAALTDRPSADTGCLRRR